MNVIIFFIKFNIEVIGASGWNLVPGDEPAPHALGAKYIELFNPSRTVAVKAMRLQEAFGIWALVNAQKKPSASGEAWHNW
jgi:hypothetical protein